MAQSGSSDPEKKPARRRLSNKATEQLLEVQKTVLDALAANEKLVVLVSSLATHALPSPNNGLAWLAEQIATQYPTRFYGQGELLNDLVPTTTRLVAEGWQPLVLMSSTDLARSYAGLAAICAQQLPIIFVLPVGVLPGQTWRPETSNDLAILRTLPDLYIGVPAGGKELTVQLTEATKTGQNPVAVYYRPIKESQRPLLEAAYHTSSNGRTLGLGRALMLREGKELAILTLGTATGMALALAERLDSAGHQAAVVNVRWVRPLDAALLTAVAHHFPRLVTLEEGDLEGSFGTAILEMLERNELYETHLKRLQLENRPSLPRLAASVTAFLETLEQDEGLGRRPNTPRWQPQPGRLAP